MTDESATVTVRRTLTYSGPAEWIRKTAERSFVTLSRELGSGKTLSSQWDDAELQAIAIAAAPQSKRATIEARINADSYRGREESRELAMRTAKRSHEPPTGRGPSRDPARGNH